VFLLEPTVLGKTDEENPEGITAWDTARVSILFLWLQTRDALFARTRNPSTSTHTFLPTGIEKADPARTRRPPTQKDELFFFGKKRSTHSTAQPI
jgi:hypothetical protein